MDERRSLASIAGRVGLSPFHFCRVFRRATGYAFPNYRRSLRLRSSLDLIAGPGTLTDIALTLGFTSHSQFTDAFRGAFGRAPSAMRRAGGSGGDTPPAAVRPRVPSGG